MDFEKLAAERYSLRKFSDRPVEAEKLAAILEAGRNAPTAHNFQPQRIFVLQSPEALEKVDGVSAVNVSLEGKTAEVTLAKDVSDDVLKAAVVDAGYEVTGITAA